MAGGGRYTALLDACVLFPPRLADALISLHAAGLFTARWTARIDQEWIDAARRARPDADPVKLVRRRDDMRAAVPDWEVEAATWEPIAASLALPDPDDVHVLAAAIAGHADCIVTANLRHFPADVLAVHGLEAIHPDDFLLYQLDLDLIEALGAFKEMRARLRNPPLTADEFAGSFEKHGLPRTAQRLREAARLI